jgi:hypothetical protein
MTQKINQLQAGYSQQRLLRMKLRGKPSTTLTLVQQPRIYQVIHGSFSTGMAVIQTEMCIPTKFVWVALATSTNQ